MRIGFAAIYSWRPHVEHLYFLGRLAESAGHETFFLACDGDLSACYSRELRPHAAWRLCAQCRLSGIRSFPVSNVSSIGQNQRALGCKESVDREWALSSASTLGRFESDEEFAGSRFREIAARLQRPVALTFGAAVNWITRNRLDAVCVFNGRMDVTRAIFEAARSLGVRVVSLERTWFGDGLQLYPEENCLGLGSVNRLVAEWRDRPLLQEQALRAASLIARRFLRTNLNEWRAYNTSAEEVAWPVTGGRRRLLLLPGSRSEVWGHRDWATGWPTSPAAYEAIMHHLQLEPSDVVLRCHPNWSEKIGEQDGRQSEAYYTKWAARVGVMSIPSKSPASTMGLIRQCDAIVVSNGSAAIEAGILGKQVIGIGPSIYQEAGFRDRAYEQSELRGLSLHVDLTGDIAAARATYIARQTLRFCYTMAFRVPLYAASVRADRTTKYRFQAGVSADSFIKLLRTGILEADDQAFAANEQGEGAVLAMIATGSWEDIARHHRSADGTFVPVRRKRMYRLLDIASAHLPVGDR